MYCVMWASAPSLHNVYRRYDIHYNCTRQFLVPLVFADLPFLPPFIAKRAKNKIITPHAH